MTKMSKKKAAARTAKQCVATWESNDWPYLNRCAKPVYKNDRCKSHQDFQFPPSTALNEEIPGGKNILMLIKCEGCQKFTHFFVLAKDAPKYKFTDNIKESFPYLEGEALSMMETKHHIGCWNRTISNLENLS